MLIPLGFDDADVEGGALGDHRQLLQCLTNEFIPMYQNERPGLPFDDQMSENHRFACTRRETDHLAPDPSQGSRFDGGQGVALVRAELNGDTRQLRVHELLCAHQMFSLHTHTEHLR
jgi:hypothetical protein